MPNPVMVSVGPLSALGDNVVIVLGQLVNSWASRQVPCILSEISPIDDRRGRWVDF